MGDIRDTFRLIQNTSLADAIAREIEAMILNGELATGERVPEMELAERFRVSRSPVREAVRALDSVGLIEVQTNRGAYVRKIDLAEALEVYEVRAALFGQAGRLMAARGSDADIARLSRLHKEMEAAAGAHVFEEYAPLNFEFHELIVDGAGNRTLASQYRMLVKRLRLFRARNLMFGDTLSQSHKEHEAIVRAIEARDAEAATAACYDHVEQGRIRLLSRVRSEEVEGQRSLNRGEETRSASA